MDFYTADDIDNLLQDIRIAVEQKKYVLVTSYHDDTGKLVYDLETLSDYEDYELLIL